MTFSSSFAMDTALYTILPRREDNGHTHGQRALVVTAVLTAIAGMIVGMRLFARARLMKIMGREDWAILISLVCLPLSQFGSAVANAWQRQTFSLVYLGLVAARKFYTFQE